MIQKAVILLCVVLCVLGDEKHATSEQKVVLRHKKIQKPEHHEEYAWSYPSYEFSYKVDDPHTNDKKGQSENREGDEVKGEYWLIEPDGRKRVVKYYSDKEIGFKADVEYSEPMKHISDEKKSNPHHADVEHQSIEHHDDDHQEEEEEEGKEEHQEEDHGDEGSDRDGHSTQHMPLKGQYRPIAYRPAIKQYEVQENYYNPRFYRQSRRQ